MFANYKPYFYNRKFLWSCAVGVVFLALGFVVNFYAALYATERASNAVTDIVLSNLPIFDVDTLFAYSPIVFWLFILYISLKKPQGIPFSLKAIALFILIRSVFISLTHVGPFPTYLPVNTTGIMGRFAFGGDLFFSGHTGLPFLMALIFWQDKLTRYICIVSAILFGALALLAHLHYSIDVLSAFFITYAIYHLAVFIFKKDQETLRNGLTP